MYSRLSKMQNEWKSFYDVLVQRPADLKLALRLHSLDDVQSNLILIEACKERQLKIVQYFKQRLKKVTRALPVNTRTAIHVAAKLDQPDYFNLLCEIYDNQVNYMDPESHFTHFQAALRFGNEQMANSLLSQGISVNSPLCLGPVGHNGYTLLSHLCVLVAKTTLVTERDTYLEMIRRLVENGADVNVVDINGISPVLHLFCRGITFGQWQTTQRTALDILLNAGANMLHRDNQGQTILHYMLRRRYLPEYHGNAFNLSRYNPEFQDFLKLVHKHKPDLNAPDNNGVTPLSYAVSVCNRDAVDELLQMGAEPTTVTFKGQFLLEENGMLRNLELAQNILDIVKLLKAKGFRMTHGHDYSVLQFLLGYPTVNHELFDLPYVMALALNPQAIISYCYQYINKSDENQQSREDSVRDALINHLKIVHLGKIYMNKNTKKWMKDKLGTRNVGEIYHQDPEILREIALAHSTMTDGKGFSLLDVCTYPKTKAYHELQLLNWQSMLNAESFRQFIRIGPTIKGCVTRILVWQFFEVIMKSTYVDVYF
ncbi:uncharacterized protein LOC106656299 [Trichogramma pretiosum]|uniref:uncharacterized protein LOC106656299 n=1 Tax=Trichogramma pretiosum TaxID=7493 RepID=UPI0006C9A59A|nr:uncharacterized protein LOC106656299 [Trichogramma pretiosum]